MKPKKQNSRKIRFIKDNHSPEQPAFSMPESPTSGQVGPKSKPKRKQGGRFRAESHQTPPSQRLRHEDDAPPGGRAGDGPRSTDKKTAKNAERMKKSKLRMDRTASKLDVAQEKLAQQKPPKKPGLVKNAGRAIQFETWRYAHGKIHQVEQENVGVEAAHKTELAGETVVRGGKCFIQKRNQIRPARRVHKWEKKHTKARADYAFRQMADQHPELAKNALSRFYQKQRIKRQYQKQAKQAAKQGGRAVQKTAELVEKAAAALLNFIKSNPKVFLIIGAVFMVFVLMQSCVGAFMTIGNGFMGAAGGTSYLAEDGDIDSAELAYTEWETDLQIEINKAETTYPDYDEYRYNVADISHNPFELMAFLTAAYDDFTYSGVESALRGIFNEQYSLTFTEEIEVRYRTETKTREVIDPITGDITIEEYEEEVAYDWYILHVKLTARSFSDVVASRMNAEQQERYQVYMVTKGNRQYLQSPFGETNWLPFVSCYYGYRVHPITGEKNYHKGADIALPSGTEIRAGQDGTVTFAGANGGYGNVVVLDDGEGLVSKYAHCSVLLVSVGQTVKAGDVIAKVGNTGDSTGPHLHLEIIKDGNYLNPLYFAVTNDYGQGPEYGEPGAPMGDGSYAALIAEAERHLGKPYVFGASGPDVFDCSGFVCYVLNQSGVASVGRTTAQGLYNRCTPVSAANAQPGDLIFFTGTYSTPNACSHVGIYVGGGQMIHCGNPISYASINTSYWQSHFYSFGRIN